MASKTRMREIRAKAASLPDNVYTRMIEDLLGHVDNIEARNSKLQRQLDILTRGEGIDE